MEQVKVLTVTLKDEPVRDENDKIIDSQLRLVVDNGDSKCDIGIDFDDGYPQAANDVQDIVLGLIARWVNWESEIKTLYHI